jgi:hypothetical protein
MGIGKNSRLFREEGAEIAGSFVAGAVPLSPTILVTAANSKPPK